ncbi:splicing factor, CC1-like protein [Basidiobolus meristosporus CBS 931.73]|uniref:Splicing factor, CC1-like protein n=1 Tax=Basidiobolus meristosporus CBS 931.73 TaxID=1314790 RepID=A0A1Y1Z5S8_9FUNG|nr:splicing factor, CC1-like protein [Basidiobolus meristosporus CBS 931.73]|eukprot:ORY05609.1 splicing factor, CC1-like protein [Basidiobolus meristosporus CBS 931.73]
MADDLDVEALLEAPFMDKSQSVSNGKEESRKEEREDKKRRDRSRSGERRRRHRSSSRERHSSRRHSRREHRSRSRDSDRDRERERRRRSRSRDRERRKSPSRSRRDRDRARSGDRRHRSRSPGKSRSSSRREFYSRHLFRLARSPSPPVSEADRDRRTVFVMQLAARLRHREFLDFFSTAGRVREAKIVADRNSRRSKGVGYVEYYHEDSVPQALALTGQKLLGIPVIVQPSEAEKNRLAAQQEAAASADVVYHRLYIGSVHFNLTEDDLRQVFEPFGPLDFVNLHRDPETGRSKGFAFIQYKNTEDAKHALEKMNGFELAGRTIKVGLVTDKGSNINYNLDDGDVAGLTLTSQSRVELMQKLARDSGLPTMRSQHNSPSSSSTSSAQPIAPVVMPSRTILLKNMFNPDEETEPNWQDELKEDISEECSKYGKIVHIELEPDSLGEVYMKFDSIDSAQNAISSLNGRWFAARQISAVFVPEMLYNVRFPRAANL